MWRYTERIVISSLTFCAHVGFIKDAFDGREWDIIWSRPFHSWWELFFLVGIYRRYYYSRKVVIGRCRRIIPPIYILIRARKKNGDRDSFHLECSRFYLCAPAMFIQGNGELGVKLFSIFQLKLRVIALKFKYENEWGGAEVNPPIAPVSAPLLAI